MVQLETLSSDAAYILLVYFTSDFGSYQEWTDIWKMADSKGMCPHRQHMDDPNIVWREGKPDFTQVNKAYLEGRTRVHKEGSLEKIVEDLVKTWEMEASHKTRIEVTLEFRTKDQYMYFSW